MKKIQFFTCTVLYLLASVSVFSQTPTLEMFAGAGNPTGNGLTTANQVITLQKNTDNPTANTIGAYTPIITVTYSLSNQQFASIEGNPGIAGSQFGGSTAISPAAPASPDGFNAPPPAMAIFNLMNAIGGSVNANYTACNPCGAGTGIDVATNRSVEILNYSDAVISGTGVQNFALNARAQYADLTLTFNIPVSYPVIHLTGMGGNIAYGTVIPVGGTVTNYTQGFATEFDMVTPGLTFTKLSGSTFFSVTANQINNSATFLGGATAGSVVNGATRYAASGTVRVNGINITSITLRMYLRGDGGRITDAAGAVVPANNGNIVRWALHDNFIPNGVTRISEGTSGDALLVGVSLPAPISVSGNVFNDINGGNVNNSTGGANVVPSGIYANLRDAGGNVVAVATVNADGTYSFPSVFEGTGYTVSLSTSPGTVGSPAPAVSLPAGWVSTGEFNGTPNTGNDGTINGISSSFTVSTTNVTNINFGIEQPPAPGTFTAASQVNPGGTNNVTVAASAFSGTDLSGGIIASLKITAFPTNATTITINGTTYTSVTFPVGGVTVSTNATGQPTQTITADPADGAVTVSIPYKVIDNAGVESTTTGAVNLPFTTLSLSGNVFNDIGGLVVNANVDGTGTGLPSGTQLYANLLNAAGTLVVATVPVNADGTYSFSSVTPNTNYIVQLSVNQGTVGSAPPAAALPANWVSTGEDCCDNAGSDGTVNSLVTVAVTTANVINANFGIEQLPGSGVNVQPSAALPGGTTQVTVPSAAFSGTDPDGGIITSIRITAFPSDATTIVINGTSYTTATFPVGGVTVPANAAGQPTQTITVDPQNGGSRVVVIPYVAIDNAGKEDLTPGSVTLPFDNSDWTVSGNVFNDLNALTDGNVNGTGVGLPSGTQLYAYLRTSASATILQAVPVSPDGTYSFPEVTNGTYTVVISTTVVTVGGTTPAVVLPVNWVLTGEDCCDNTGSDGTVNGTTNFTMASANVSNVNFGIEQLPNSGVNTQPSQTNPGGTTSVAVPATAFSGTDPDGGTPISIRIAAFPTNATTITINGTMYTSGTFPGGGVTVPTNSSGQPAQTISVDPIDGNVSVVISYAAIDNGGNEDPTPGSVTLPFFNVNLSGNVFNDVNGLTDNTVNGTGIGLPSGTQLYANLLDATGITVIATVPIGAGGAYNFTGIPGNTNYVVQVSTNQGTVGQPAPATALPANWVNTGENIGAGTGNDGTVNSLLPVSVSGVNIIDANFGIEQLPNSGTNTQPLQSNPSGTANVTVPASAFNGSDPDGGIISSIEITAFPTNATSITINGTTYTSATFPAGGVVVPTNAGGQPAQTITVDPVDGLVNVVIAYTAIDNAGKEDPTAGSVTLPFSNLNISGNVFNDANGLNGTGNVDGSGMGTAGGSQLYANLLDATGTTVIATVPVNTDGTYNFYGVTSNTNYVVQLSMNQGTVGSPAPVKALPAGWVNTGEDCCDNAGSDGIVNGLTAVSVISSDISNVNFGINRPPTGTDITAAAQLNPGGVIQVQVPALSGSDPEDGVLGSGATIRIDVLPTNATIYYNGVPVVTGVPIPNYNPALLTIDPDPNTAAQPALLAAFSYSFADAAGVFDPMPKVINMQFLTPVAIIGNVFNDVNGSANNTHLNIQDGAETGTNAANQLYAYIVDINTGLIIRKDTVNADGTYSFDGLSVIGNVRIMITTDNTIVGAAPPLLTLPVEWANTSPLDTTFTYNNPPGFLIMNVNFGIEEIPESFNSTQPTQANPGGTTSVTVAPAAFYAEDVAIGTITSIRITAFPTNVTSITINGITYGAGFTSFPAGGVMVPTNGNGQPTVPISIDPINGTISVSITYTAIDNAGREDPTAATVVLEFSSVLPLRNIVLNGNLNGGIITINWNTIGELDVNKFELQRSLDGVNFISITNQLSKGDGDKAYHAADNQFGINGKVAYYRIKIIDKNGNYSYSSVIKVNLDELKGVVIRPNPFIGSVNLQFNVLQKTSGTVNIYNIDGKKVYGRYFEFAQGLNSIEANGLEKLPAGVYIIELTVEGAVKTEKIIKAEK